MTTTPEPGGLSEGSASPAGRNFCEKVEALRRERGYSPEALAARSKIDPGELAAILRGEGAVGVDAIYLLAGALGVPPEDLLKGIEWRPPVGDGSGWTITGGGQDG